MRRPTSVITGAIAAAALSTALVTPASAAITTTYEVTITNLIAGQPLTPPAVATHRGDVSVFTVGSPASSGVQQIAENGNPATLIADLEGTPGVSEALVTGSGPLVLPSVPGGATFDGSVTFTITARAGARFLSWVSMLICTNDGFTGVNRLRLPTTVGGSVSVSTFAYDAGTEIDTEDFADMVPPCQALVGVASDDPGTGTTNPALAEGGVIHHHEGIMGISDLDPEIHGWDVDEPVATIDLTRVS
jgi:hypothetical protein